MMKSICKGFVSFASHSARTKGDIESYDLLQKVLAEHRVIAGRAETSMVRLNSEQFAVYNRYALRKGNLS